MRERHEQLVATGREIVQSAPQLYVDLDVEADGVAGYGSLLSIGAVSPWGEQFYRELRPTSDLYIPENRLFCEAHGLQHARLLDEGVPPEQALRQLAEWEADLRSTYQKRGKSVLVAFNASYDFPLVNLEYARAKLDNPFGIAGYCVKSLAMAFQPDYDWAMTSKNRLPEELIPDGDFTHNALEDAVYQQKLHFAMVGALSEHAA